VENNRAGLHGARNVAIPNLSVESIVFRIATIKQSPHAHPRNMKTVFRWVIRLLERLLRSLPPTQMPKDHLFQPVAGVSRLIRLESNADFTAEMLGALVVLSGHTLTLTPVSGYGFFIVAGGGGLAGNFVGTLTADQAMMISLVDGDFHFIDQPDADLATLIAHVASTANPHATTKAQVGLGNVDNTSDSAKPVSTAQENAIEAAKARSSHTGIQAISTIDGLQAALNAKAALISPAFSGTPTAPTPSLSTNTSQIATTGFVQALVAAIESGAPVEGALTYNSQVLTALQMQQSRLNIQAFSYPEFLNSPPVSEGRAMGSITVNSTTGIVGNTLTIGSTVYGFVSSGAGPNEISIGTIIINATNVATNIANRLNSLNDPLVKAVSEGPVVYLTSRLNGAAGNDIFLATTAPLSITPMSGGVDQIGIGWPFTTAEHVGKIVRVGRVAPFRWFRCFSIDPTLWFEEFPEAPPDPGVLTLPAGCDPNKALLVITGNPSPDVRGNLVYAGIDGEGAKVWSSTGSIITAGSGISAKHLYNTTFVVGIYTAGVPSTPYFADFTVSGAEYPDETTPVGFSGALGTISLLNAPLPARFIGDRLRVGNSSPYLWFRWDGTIWEAD
jgi:hypothetical protein